MGKLPALRGLTMEEFPDQKEWIGKLISPLNGFISEITTNLNNGLTFESNMAAFFSTVEVIGGNFPVYVSNPLRINIKGAIIIGAYPKSDINAVIGNALFPEWIAFDKKVKIKNISGLTADTRYMITFLFIGG